MKDLGLKDRLSESQITRAWRDIVGDFIAGHSAPSRLHDGVLIVAVLQPTVQFELERVWKIEILKKLKTRFGARTIRDIRFRIGG
jgi:predicted nucleic acid-binding Zn ribbon protein